MEYYMLLVKKGGEIKKYLSLIGPEAFKKGVNGKAIFGFLKSGTAITPDNFVANKEFKDFMHSIIAEEVLNDPFSKEEAKRIKDGHVFIIDARTKTPQGDVPPYDIFGAIKASNGKLVRGTYSPNPNYRLVSTDGLFQLSKTVEKRLLAELRKM